MFLPDAQPLRTNSLPPLPDVACIIRSSSDGGRATRRLVELTRELIVDAAHV